MYASSTRVPLYSETYLLFLGTYFILNPEQFKNVSSLETSFGEKNSWVILKKYTLMKKTDITDEIKNKKFYVYRNIL